MVAIKPVIIEAGGQSHRFWWGLVADVDVDAGSAFIAGRGVDNSYLTIELPEADLVVIYRDDKTSKKDVLQYCKKYCMPLAVATFI